MTDEVELDHGAGTGDLEKEVASWWARIRAAWKAGPVKIIVMLAVATAANFGINGYTIVRISDEAAQSCQDRKEARDSVRQLVILATAGVQPGRSTLADQLRLSLEPGQPLEEIRCP